MKQMGTKIRTDFVISFVNSVRNGLKSLNYSGQKNLENVTIKLNLCQNLKLKSVAEPKTKNQLLKLT